MANNPGSFLPGAGYYDPNTKWTTSGPVATGTYNPDWNKAASVSPTSSAPAATTTTPPTPPPAPVFPKFKAMSLVNYAIKQAPKDTVVFDDNAVDVALIEDLLYEDIGGVELANTSREDLIDGIDVNYSIIYNLSQINREYNPTNAITSSVVDNDYATQFAINIFDRGYGSPAYDSVANVLEIEIDFLYDDEDVELEMLSNAIINTVDDS